MIRSKLIDHRNHRLVDGFRWRSHEIARIEGFSDAVFGFAVTLLIVSLEVPRTSTELLVTMRGFGSFVVTFLILAGIWYKQFVFFRCYGLEDRFTVIMNLVLLFTVLFFTFPLKFLFGVILADPPMTHLRVETAHGSVLAVLPEHRSLLFLIFGIGFAAVFGVFLLLYRHAYKKRVELDLNEFEIFETRHTMQRMILAVGIGVGYLALAAVQKLPQRTAGEKLLSEGAAMAVLLAFMVVLGRIAVMTRTRKRVAAEWHVRRLREEAELENDQAG